MKLLIIFTGGTIGCRAKQGFIASDEKAKYSLIENCPFDLTDAEISTSCPYTILSEQLSAKELNVLQDDVENALSKSFDGIIITHGTDTLQYTACALEYAFSDANIPIVLVSAAFPLDHPQTNGYSNFEAAFEFIKNKGGKGVFVSYRNSDSRTTCIHLPCRILAHSETSSELSSIDRLPFAEYVNEQKKLCVLGKKPDAFPLGKVEYCDDSKILVIESRPGDSFSYSLDGISSIILKPYHSATLNTSDARFSYLCKRAAARNIPVFLVNAKDGDNYESTRLFAELGILPLPYGTYISAYMKLWAAQSLEKDPKSFMYRRISSEMHDK